MTLRHYFLDPPRPTWAAGYRYGFLAVIVALVAGNVHTFLTRSPGYQGDPYGGLIIAIMLLSNHVAYQFHLPPRVTVSARFLAIGWTAFGLFWVFYRGRALYPLR